MSLIQELSHKDMFETPIVRGDIVVHVAHRRTRTYLVARRVTDFTNKFLVLDENHRVSPHNVFKTDDPRFELGKYY